MPDPTTQYRTNHVTCVLHQRHVVLLVPGTEPGTQTTMMIGATCLRAFNDEWRVTFQGILGSIELQHQAAQEDVPATEADVATPAVPFGSIATLQAHRDRTAGA